MPWIEDAPAFLIFVGNGERLPLMSQLRGKPFPNNHHPQVVSELLHLPDRTVPVVGLCVGWPTVDGEITPRLSLRTTLVNNGYIQRDVAGEIDAYDRRRTALRPYRRQRNVEFWGQEQFYGGRKTRLGNMPNPHVLTLAGLCAKKGFASIRPDW